MKKRSVKRKEREVRIGLTPRMLDFYDRLIAEYYHHLGHMASVGVGKDEKKDQRLAIGLCAISCGNSAKAVSALYHSDLGDSTLIFVRSQFEQAAKAEYFATRPDRARDFLDLEPFERYWLAKDYELSAKQRDAVIGDCKAAVKEAPRLLKHQKVSKAGRQRADFLAIREALKVPAMEDLLSALKWPIDLYVTVFLFGSLRVHGSINDLRDYIDSDGKGGARFKVDIDLSGPPDYLGQSSNYLFGFIGKIAKWFHGCEREAEVKALYEERERLNDELKAADN